MWTSELFGVKNFGFFEIYGVSARTKSMWDRASADILQTRREGVRGSIFRDFVRTSFMDGPLS